MYYDESELKKRLGINKSYESWNSYSKHLNSNHVLAYDNEAIYLIDKLSITYETNYDSVHFTKLKKHGNEFHFIYRLNNGIELRKEKVNNNYHFNYTIISSGETFGNLLIQNTSQYNGVKIEVSNYTLYQTSKLAILQLLFELSIELDLMFKNISAYEIARDSDRNYYNEFCMIQYQSDFCPNQVHEIYGSKPKYSFHRKRLHVSHEVDSKNTSFGTVRIGSNESDTQLKIYVKSNELKSWAEEKSYISEIHSRYFPKSNIISRVEVRANCKAIKKHNWDLLDLLVPENHVEVFSKLLDAKLKFKNLETKKWDSNKNEKFETIDLINLIPSSQGILTLPISTKFQITHLNNTNKFKTVIYMFFDNELSSWGLIEFFRKNLWNNSISHEKYNHELEKAVKNYRNPKTKLIAKKIDLVRSLINSRGDFLPVLKAVFNVLF